MRDEQLLKTILAPHLSEKANLGGKNKQYIFKVARHADKKLVKDAIQKLFKVNVRSVNTSNVRSRNAVKMGRSVGKHAAWKKAYVVLEADQEISLA